jgi:fructan beta-fructosidase
MMKAFYYSAIIIAFLSACRSNEQAPPQPVERTEAVQYKEQYRPQVHFSPPKNWMNDPNGMVYYEGEYHLFYQHYPDSNVWGPMHWGHAISKDLVKWENQPIALYPDSLGLIFSGSAVVDKDNTSGFGSKENPALIAMFTYHSLEKEKKGRIDYQTQGIAYSTDKGRTWTKYEANPVIKNPGIKDFRDPKVFWHDETKKWIVVLAVQDHIEFWASPDMKNWTKLSEFGKEFGAHGGVWECPDMFKLKNESTNREEWVLLVSLNPGGPNGGSATQYFVGDFNGKDFKPRRDKTATQWLDYGPDNYAGVTFFNAPEDRKIFIGWMSNWAYAQEVPTVAWRSAATAPRDLTLTSIEGISYVKSKVSPEYLKAAGASQAYNEVVVRDSLNISLEKSVNASHAVITGEVEAKDFALEFSNQDGQKVLIGFDQKQNAFYLDRSSSGRTDFSSNFKGRNLANRVSKSDKISFTLVKDASSAEVFFDDGLSVLTAVFFPDEDLSTLKVLVPAEVKFNKIEVRQLNPIW